MRFAGLVKTAALGALLGAMLAFPLQAAGSALGALTAFALSVLPALLPFSVCARLLTAGRRLPPGLIAALG
ncbi:MAG: hypothetical protein IJS53_03545, partial [Clostridia bacterium]|nr:hypothetical protein [Clostridia bacterium]